MVYLNNEQRIVIRIIEQKNRDEQNELHSYPSSGDSPEATRTGECSGGPTPPLGAPNLALSASYSSMILSTGSTGRPL